MTREKKRKKLCGKGVLYGTLKKEKYSHSTLNRKRKMLSYYHTIILSVKRVVFNKKFWLH